MIWTLARTHKKNIFGKITYMHKRFYRNPRRKYLAFAACQYDNIVKFKTKDEAENHLYNRFQKYHDLPTDFKAVRRNWESE